MTTSHPFPKRVEIGKGARIWFRKETSLSGQGKDKIIIVKLSCLYRLFKLYALVVDLQ